MTLPPACRSRFVRVACIVGALALTALGRAAEGTADTAPVALPPFLVEEPTKGPSWRYAYAAGYEVLSRCDERTTRRVVEAHHRLHQLLEEILPPSLQLSWTVPRALILYPEELQPAASREVIEKMLRDKPNVPSVELDLPGRRTRLAEPAGRGARFLPNIRLWDRDSMTVFMIVRSDDFDGAKLSLTYDYISFLVKHRVPGPPLWFVSGFLDLYREIKYEGSELVAKPLVWISDEHSDALRNNYQTAPSVMEMDVFLSSGVPAVTLGDIPPLKRWQAQAALFVRWGLDSGGRERREGFWKFTARCAQQAPTEALFQECFGMDFATAQAQLSAYLLTAVRKEPTYAPKRFAKLPPYTLLPASDAQLARIKGDLERLEVPYVKNISADLGPKYLEQARKTLRKGYERASTDPQLLAILGLCELEAGNLAAAREYLESGAQIGGMRPRAFYELAKLRLADLSRTPEGPDGKLSVSQLAEVLRPLFSARESLPPLYEVYELMAEAWAASAAPASRRHLGVLDEGVRYFPRRLTLVLRTAELYSQHGFRDEATALLNIATQIADSDTSRERVAALRSAVEGR
ncbi:MAG: hypothetical protein V4773_12720 [Verrucomicrobiota bacterium]